jgi:hypothetical protein
VINVQDDSAAGAPRYSARAFWIGLPVVALLAAACWMGAMHAEDRVITERAVYERGVLTTGTVVKKTLYHRTYQGEQTHYITYSFRTPEGSTFRKEIRIESHVWNTLREGGPLTIRYVPDRPSQNLPDGWHMTSYFYLVGGMAFGGALLFSVIAAGMLIKKLTGGYRGEAHPFPGKR